MLVKTYGREGLQHRQIKWNVNLPQDEKCTSTGQKFITLSNNCFTICSGIIQIHCTIQIQIQKQITKLHCCFTSSSCRTIYCLCYLPTQFPKCIWPKKLQLFSKQLALSVSSLKETTSCVPLPSCVSLHWVPFQWARLTLGPNDIGSVTAAVAAGATWGTWGWGGQNWQNGTKGHLCHHSLTHCPISQAVQDSIFF